LTGDWVVLGFQRIYYESMGRGDFRVALKALENIGKFLGIFEKGNRQHRRPAPEDIEAAKARLRTRGIDLDALAAQQAAASRAGFGPKEMRQVKAEDVKEEAKPLPPAEGS